MIRLINAEALAEVLVRHEKDERSLSEYEYGFNAGLEIAEMEVEDAPTIDAIPVTRCRDCRHYTGKWCTIYSTKQFDINDICKADDDFCSMAERKEG